MLMKKCPVCGSLCEKDSLICEECSTDISKASVIEVTNELSGKEVAVGAAIAAGVIGLIFALFAGIAFGSFFLALGIIALTLVTVCPYALFYSVFQNQEIIADELKKLSEKDGEK